jgi:hypothetical protein
MRCARQCKTLIASGAALVMVLVVVMSAVWVLVDTTQKGSQTHDAVCIFRADLERRAEDGRTFLKNNPDGIPGIPAAVIQTSIDNQERTIAALASLDC